MTGKKITNFILLLSLGIFLFGSGYKIGQLKNNSSSFKNFEKNIINSDKNTVSSQEVKDFNLFWETWDELKQKFIDKNKLDAEKMYYGAIKGMVSSLEDPYTFFLTPDENKEAKNDLAGKFEGIGAQLGLQNSRIIVVAPLKNSPAKKAGIKAGDFINKVDGQTTKDWTLPQAVSKIRGPQGSKVILTLERNNKEFDVGIVRDEIKVESVELSYEKKGNKNLAYLKLNQFGDNTNVEWDKSVAEISLKWKNRQINGMILDVRDNPGGYLDSSVYIASEFLPLGKLIVKQTSTVEETKAYYAERGGTLTDIPLVVIINRGSASASEILAGALRDYKKAELVGEKSFGKGSVQEASNLSEGAGLHVTVAKWILPNGDWINGKGIEPDVKVENDLKNGDSLTREKDMQLEKAIDILLK